MDMSIFNQIKSFARSRCLPIIPIKAKDVSIISDPNSYYKSILNGVSLCKNRLALSALYLGTGTKERALIQGICDNLAKEPDLKVDLVLDAHRATRKDVQGTSSISALEKLLAYSNVRLSLVETQLYQSTIDRFLRKFQRWNELSSIYHTKFLVFDNDVIVTGANLSDIYFENRQDRYMLIRNSKLLSDYVSDLLSAFDTNDCKKVSARVRRLNEQYVSSIRSGVEEADSYVIPLVQFGMSGLSDKEDLLMFLNSILPPGAQIHLSSGYFNPSDAMNRINISSVLAPSEEANGFFSGNGLLKYVPRLYSVLHQQYLENHNGCSLYHYDRAGWSFHAKGVWVTGLGDLYIHLIGSSNFNCRSSKRDLETELLLLTTDKDLAQRLELERSQLWKESIQREFPEPFNQIYKLMARAVKSFL